MQKQIHQRKPPIIHPVICSLLTFLLGRDIRYSPAYACRGTDSFAFLLLAQHRVQLTGEEFAIEVAVDIGVDVCIGI